MQQMQLEGIPACVPVLTTHGKHHRHVINEQQHGKTDQHPQLPNAQQHWRQAAADVDSAGQDLLCINLQPGGSDGSDGSGGSKAGCSEGPVDEHLCPDVDNTHVHEVLRPQGQCLHHHQTAVRAPKKSH